jgi:hypothetical protein
MKPPSEWSEADLLELIHLKTEENIQLDFKRADSLGSSDGKKNEISKDVSAFANSAGGTIVYGIAESQNEPHCAESLSPINPSTYSKEWLEQVINSRIQRRIQGVLINAVTLAGGQVAYVVCIPQSVTAHQASDHRYYRRFNFESVPMEDYEVRQTLNRTSRAEYSVQLQAGRKGLRDSLLFFEFQCVVENVSELLGQDVSVIILVPKHLMQNPGQHEMTIADGIYTRIPGTWAATVVSGLGTPINLPPLSPRPAYFERELATPPLHSSEPLRVFIRIFDRNGLALTTEVRLSFPGLDVISTQAIQNLP